MNRMLLKMGVPRTPAGNWIYKGDMLDGILWRLVKQQNQAFDADANKRRIQN